MMSPHLAVSRIACLAAMAAFLGCAAIAPCQQNEHAGPREWLRHVRVGAYAPSELSAEQIVQQAEDSGVYGIEVDNDITGRYDGFLQPEARLEQLRKVARVAHQHGNKVFVYIAGLECISPDSNAAHTVMKDHPDWVQRNIKGDPALFDTKAAFWIRKGEEDTWISPYAPDWRRLYMTRVRQIAATGVDGIYVDIPYWMTHFKGWEDTWASFDKATVAAFHQQTGLNAPTSEQLGNFENPVFQKWVEFRIRTVTNFLADIRKNAVSVSPNISLIPEIYPGIESDAVRVGPDVYDLYRVSDAIAHEYEFGGGDDHTAASRSPFDWMMYQVGIRTFRAFAGSKPTWILNYSWDGAPHVPAAEAMQTMFMSELAAGANLWDASGHVMSGSNDLAERTAVYHWIAAHDAIFSSVRQPLGSVGVYFSDATRNRYADEFVNSYRGTLLQLLQAHQQFQVVTPRTLHAFHGRTLVLPAVRLLSDAEVASIRRFAEDGGHIVFSGPSDQRLDQLTHADRFPDNPGQRYATHAQQDFAHTQPESEAAYLRAMTSSVDPADPRIEAASDVVVHAADIGGTRYLFLANFAGIEPGKNVVPLVQTNLRIDLPASAGMQMHVLPFLGDERLVTGQREGSRVHFVLPELQRGAVVWFK